MSSWKDHADPPPLLHVQRPARAHSRSKSVFLQTGRIVVLLTILLFTELLSSWPITPPVAHAATFTPFASSPGSLTLQKFLQQGQPDKKKHGVFGIPASALTQAHVHASKIKASTNTPPLPSAEPAKMQPLSAALDSSFLTQGTQMPATASPTPTATSPPVVTPTATSVVTPIAPPAATSAAQPSPAAQATTAATPIITPTPTSVATPQPSATTQPQARSGSSASFNRTVPLSSALQVTPTAVPVTTAPAPVSTTTPAATPTPPTPISTAPLVLKGSDGRLEVDVPRGSLNFSTATLVGGGTPVAPLTLQITEISGHSVGSSNLLGRYLLQVVDSSGKPLQGVTLSQPLTIRYHYQKGELFGLNLDPNNIFLSYPGLIPQVTSGTPAPTGNLVVPFTNNPTTQTLTAQTTVLGVPSASATGFQAVSFTAHPAATLTASAATATVGGPSTFVPPPTPLLATVQGNSGQLSYDYPLSVPAGPGGFQPELKLSYSSGNTNSRHDPRSPADSPGDGWSIPMPSVSQSWYGESSAGDGQFYYTLSDVDHVSDRLAAADNSSTTVKFVTEHVSHLRIRLDGTDNSSNADSCFHVWGLDGTYYELGCTTDSNQCSISSNGNCTSYLYNVNKMVAPFDNTGHVRMMLITYEQDQTGSGSTQMVRDSVIKQIRYGIATSPTASSLSTTVGTVDFLYHGVKADSSNSIDWVKAYGTNYNCSSSPDSDTKLRCDDTEKVNGHVDPSVMSTYELDSVISYVGSDSSSSHKAYQYSFKYKDSPGSSSYQDPMTGDTEGSAGQHTLTSVTPTIFQNGTGHQRKGVTFGYTTLRNTYYDSWQQPNGNYQVSNKWPYLTSYRDLDTGTAGTVTYQTAENNTHGAPYVVNSDGSVDDRHDPLYCALHANDSSSSTQCTGNYNHPDERAWSEQVVTQTQVLGTDSSASALTPATTTYKYQLGVVDSSHVSPSNGCNPISVSSPPGQSDCVADTWVPKALGGSTDLDWKDYYHGDFVGFNTVYTTSPAGNLKADYYYTTEGWGTYASDAANYNSGQLYQSDTYEGSQLLDSALLTRTTNTLTGEGGNATSCDTNIEKLYSPCLEMTVSTRTTDYEGTGSSNSNAPWVETDSTYDDYSPSSGYNNSNTLYHELLTQTTSSSNAPTQTKKMRYQVNDQTNNGVVYYHLVPIHSELDDSSGHVWQCQDTAYDEGSSLPVPSGGWATTSTTYSNCADQANTAIKTYTAYDATGNVLASVDAFGANNSAPYHSNGCQTPFSPTALSGSWTLGRYTACTTYDGSGVHATSSQNVFSQGSTTTYDSTQGGVPTSTTDLNGQTTSTSYSYDSSGNRTISLTQPGETGSYTRQSSELSNCTSSSTLPCYQIDSVSSQFPNAIKRTFYDSQGQAAEMRTPGPDAGHDTITFTVTNDTTNASFQSVGFRVPTGSGGWVDPASATDESGAAPAGTTTYKDALGRVIATQDPLLGSASEPGISCPNLTGTWTSCTSYGLGSPTNDSKIYAYTLQYDANNHVSVTFTDSLRRSRFTQGYSGTFSSLSQNVIKEQETQYNALNKPTAVIVTDRAPQSGQTTTSVTTSATYDDLGRLTALNDPDRGTHTYTYDADGHQLTDVSGSRTIGTSYDLLGRAICVQDAAPTTDGSGSCSSGSHPLVQNTYDQSKLGTVGSSDFPVGQLTQSVGTTYYSDGSSTQVTEQFQHDARERIATATLQVGLSSTWNVTNALPTYQQSLAYDDSNNVTTTKTTVGGQAGYTFTQVYDSTTGIIDGLSNNATGAANLATLNYDLHGLISDVNFLSTTGTALADNHYTFDGNLRPSSATATWQSGSGTIFNVSRNYDPAGNVTSESTGYAPVPGQSNSGGAETQNFCYDEQNQLVWAGDSGTQPAAGNGTCGTATLSNSLGGNSYNTAYAYTHLDQFWQGPLDGTGNNLQYLYCDTQHPHQLTGVYPVGTSCSSLTGTNYYASYDAWGNMVTRTTNAVTSTLAYDPLDHLTQWSANSNSQEQYAYDATGTRILRRSTTGTGVQMTVYAFGLEEHVYDGSGTNLSNTYYYLLHDRLIGKFDGTNTQFYLTDELGSVLSTFSDYNGGGKLDRSMR